MLRIAIVGLGPWGLCALERVVTLARTEPHRGLELAVHVIEPRTPGSGVYDVGQPDYLLLNNPCGQISLFPFVDDPNPPAYAVGLHEWAVGQGYRWVDDRCVVVGRAGSRSAPIEPHHFVPRRVMGEYLQWFYRTVVADAPASVSVTHHPTAAVDIAGAPQGEQRVLLGDGSDVRVDHVIVTSGHTANEEDEHAGRSHPPQLKAYPVTAYVDALRADQTVAVSGLGLVGLDVLAALTVGRGGRFEPDGDLLRYRPGGREPRIHMYSRSGLPYTAKSVTGMDRTNVYKPIICTPDALRALGTSADGTARGIDIRGGLLPLLFAEMYCRYYAQVVFQAGSAQDGAAVRAALSEAWTAGRFDAARAQMGERYGAFDAQALFFGHLPRYASSADYEAATYDAIAADLREAQVPDGASPVKSAAEVFRIFRDPIRSVIENGGPSLDSYLDFHADLRSRINRLVAGPPAVRSQQLLALMDAGFKLPYGPAPALGHANGGSRTRIASTMLAEPCSSDVDVVIRGHLEEPRIDGSASDLLRALYGSGRVSQFRYGSVTVGSIDLTPDAHPVALDGAIQQRLWMFGVLTEGIRHFTHYIPSPRSRIRAVEEIGACVRAILDG